MPIHAIRAFARLRAAVNAGSTVARLREYWKTVVKQWSLVLGLAAVWALAGRPFDALGVTVPTGSRLALTALVALLVLVFFVNQMRTVRGSPTLQARVREQLDAQPALRVLIPRTGREMQVFVVLGLTAGCCEEVLYRGFIWWYFAGVMPSPWLAALAAIALFGLAHAYQGRRGILMTGIVGALALGAYLATGSLILPVVMHATIDVTNGLMARGALAAEPDGSC
jgi:membrane protease YdiL (CAAX protease family)